ncbi:MAG: chorismate synthase [Thermoprotei archaeon]|nr:chorismate synthase [TACK group archaeon]
MPGSSFGKAIKVTTFGESHGPAVGAVIDGLPAGLPISEDDISFELRFRRPGRRYVSTRMEPDRPEIISGTFNGVTTGMPLTIVVENRDAVPAFYDEIRYKPRPGHADLPYIRKYGYENWDYRGGGRSSARETVARVAAGAVAKKLLMLTGTLVAGYLKSVGELEEPRDPAFEDVLRSRRSEVRCVSIEGEVKKLIARLAAEGDSVGGVVEVRVRDPPRSLGEPVFDKLKADLAKACMSIPAAVGFEYGMGFPGSRRRGSEVADEIRVRGGEPVFEKNVAGGILGGLSTGDEMVIRVAFKPTSSTRTPVKTVDLRDMSETTLSVGGRHDPCVAIRAVSVVESMVALTLADHAKRAGIIPANRIVNAEEVQKRWEEYVKA